MRNIMTDVPRRGHRVGIPSGYSVGPTTEDKELCTDGRPNDKGDVLRRVMGPRATPLSPRTAGALTISSPPKKKENNVFDSVNSMAKTNSFKLKLLILSIVCTI